MIPLRDDIPTTIVPVVNYLIIALCTLVFVAEAIAPDGGEELIFDYGMIPARFQDPDLVVQQHRVEYQGRRPVVVQFERQASTVNPWFTLFSSMFLHGGLMHIVGNMLFLYIFGDNIEDRYGHIGYALMYLLCGLIAAGLHYWSGPNSSIPTVGASGAIAGVMGAYLVMFRHARVMTLIPLGVFSQIIAVPASFFLVLWFGIQLVSAAGPQQEGGGVAFWAHVGGFVAGVAMTVALSNLGILRHATPQQTAAWRRHEIPWR